MGFAVSYVAFNSTPKRVVLALARLRETALLKDEDAFYEIAELPTGWTLLLVDDERYASDERLRYFSANHAVVGCQVEEHSTWSAAGLYIRGQLVWRVSHYNGKEHFQLEVRGDPPPEFRVVRSTLEQKQRIDGERNGVSYIFDVPVQLAENVCGFRYDRSVFRWGTPVFYGPVPSP